MSLSVLAALILDNACSNPSTKEGWNDYVVEVHCVQFTVTARKVDGVWEVSPVVSLRDI